MTDVDLIKQLLERMLWKATYTDNRLSPKDCSDQIHLVYLTIDSIYDELIRS